MRAKQSKGYTVSSTVIEMSDFGFDADNVHTAVRAIVTAVTQNAMMLWDGTDPTATLGHPVVANGDQIIVVSKGIPKIKLIRQGESDAHVTITLER